MLTRWPLTHASQANFSPSINMADQGELWCNWGDQALGGAKGRGGGQARGFGAMEEAALVDAKIVRGTRYQSDAVKKV